MAPRYIMTSQPFTNSPSGNPAFRSRLADASLFSRYKGEDLKARKTGQGQRRALRPAGRRGDGPASAALARSLLLLFQMYFKLTSTRKRGFLIAGLTCFPRPLDNGVQRGSEPRHALNDTDINPDEVKATGLAGEAQWTSTKGRERSRFLSLKKKKKNP